MKIRRVGTMKERCLRLRKKKKKVTEKSHVSNCINRKWILGLMMTLAVSFEVDDVCVNGKFKAIDSVCLSINFLSICLMISGFLF